MAGGAARKSALRGARARTRATSTLSEFRCPNSAVPRRSVGSDISSCSQRTTQQCSIAVDPSRLGHALVIVFPRGASRTWITAVQRSSYTASATTRTHHETVRPLIPQLRPLRQIVQDTGLVDVVQRGHVRHHLRIGGERLREALGAARQRQAAEHHTEREMRTTRFSTRTTKAHSPHDCMEARVVTGV